MFFRFNILPVLLFLSRTAASPIAPAAANPPALITCQIDISPNSTEYPWSHACLDAINSIITREEDDGCPDVILYEYTVAMSQNCHIKTFSKQGHAHCLDRVQLRNEAARVHYSCMFMQDDMWFTGGQADFVKLGDDDLYVPTGDGVKLVEGPFR